MSAHDDQLPPGWLTQFRRGAVSGIALLLLVIGVCAIPAFAVWFVPGIDTAPASSAVKAAVLVALAGAHGGMVLNGTHTTLTPLLVTALLGWLVAGHARRAESWSGVAGLMAGYGIGSALAARWAQLGSTHAPAWPSLLAALVFTGLVASAARAAAPGWAALGDRWRRVLRATGAICCCYLLAGSLLAAGALIGSFQDAASLQRQAAPGVAGLPVALLGVSATPNAVIAAIGYLTGPGFAVGTHTSVSVTALSRGPMPVFPMLAGIPHGSPATVFGVLAILVLALVAGWLMVRIIAPAESWVLRLLDCTAVAVLTAGLLAGSSALAAGGLGTGALQHVGPLWWSVGGSAMLVLLFGAAVSLSVHLLPGQPKAHAGPSLYAVQSSDPSPAHEPQPVRASEAVAEPGAGRSRNAS